MNNARRKQLQAIIDQLTDLQFSLEVLCDEEQEYRDNMPDNLQDSEKAQMSDDAMSNLWQHGQRIL